MKGLILCAGKGTRLRPLTYTTAKHLIPVANKPVILYNLEFMSQAKVKEIGIVVSPENEKLFRETLGDGAKFGLSLTYILQHEPKGIAHAVYQAKDFLKDEPFLMILGDNLIFENIEEIVENFPSSSYDAAILVSQVPDPRAYGVAVLENGKVKYLVEKPKEPPSNLAIVGVYLFKPIIFKAIEKIKPSWRGELEITDAIQNLVENGYNVAAHVISGWWKDTGKPEDLLEANRKILDSMRELHILGTVDENSIIQGRVCIGKGSFISNSVIRGPVIIGENARITDSYIGPYTAIGNQVVLENCEVENSILMDRCTVIGIKERLESSILGKEAKVFKGDKIPKAVRVILGDLSSVEL
nr:glucose-1-phosphate thymidylyltransferase [Pseudothermotoga thermarum]